ncbi:MAG: hypothetical protein ACE366_12580 [Bradymonadia bacterium]
MSRSAPTLLCLAFAFVWGCDGDSPQNLADAIAASDARPSIVDGALLDAQAPDLDAGSVDGTLPPDSALSDATSGDVGDLDAGTLDGQLSDGTAPDAEPPDVDPSDAGADLPDVEMPDALFVNPRCENQCARAVECGLVEDAARCGELCTINLQSDDPLTAHRARITEACIDATPANACGAILDCLSPPPAAAPLPDATCEAFCEAQDVCGTGFSGCLEICQQRVSGGGYQVFVNCGTHYLGGGRCDESNYQLCARSPEALGGIVGRCTTLCEHLSLCEHPAGVDAEACRVECQRALNAVEDPQQNLWRTRIPCIDATRCLELDACMEALSPEVQCPRHCEAAAACDLRGPAPQAVPECTAQCLALQDRPRWTNWNVCMSEALTAGEGEAPEPGFCDPLRQCAVADPPPCGLYCARLAECERRGAGPECEASCDTRALLGPDLMHQLITCVVAADACEGTPTSVQGCLDFPRAALPPLEDCHRRCRAEVVCTDPPQPPGDDARWAACLDACAEGLPTDAALQLHAASECLLGVSDLMACPDVRACLPEVAEVSCDALCIQLNLCGVAPPQCEAWCQGSPDRALAACVAEATRLVRGCDGVAACLPPP